MSSLMQLIRRVPEILYASIVIPKDGNPIVTMLLHIPRTVHQLRNVTIAQFTYSLQHLLMHAPAVRYVRQPSRGDYYRESIESTGMGGVMCSYFATRDHKDKNRRGTGDFPRH